MRLKDIIILQNKIDLVTESVAQNQFESIQKFIQGTIAGQHTHWVTTPDYVGWAWMGPQKEASGLAQDCRSRAVVAVACTGRHACCTVVSVDTSGQLRDVC
jgi:hypothetical protein